MAGVLAITGAFAFLTDFDSAENKFSFLDKDGNQTIEIDLVEPNWDLTDNDQDGIPDAAEHAIYGNPVSKDPKVLNLGENDVYTFIKVLVPTKKVITANPDGTWVHSDTNDAFANQTAITSVTMTNNIIEIGDSAFAECINLQSVNLSKNLTTCGASAFADCDNIKAITIPASLYTIPSDMFSSCDRLTAVTIEEQQGEQSETETPSGSDSEEGRSISSSAFGSCDLLKKVWIPKDIKTIDSSAFSNSMENLTIYGEAQSAAAHYASENLLDFVVLGKNEFKNVASAATATEKMTLGDSVESDRWKISFNAAYSLRGSFNYTTSGKQKEKTLQNGNELIVLCYSVKNISGSDQEFNFLDVSAKVNGYTHKISSYGSIGYSQLAQYDGLLVGKVKSGEILYGYIAIETTAGWKNASVQFLNDTALESYSFDIKADSKDITYIGSANDPAENAQASETVPAEIQTTKPITETETEATSLKQS